MAGFRITWLRRGSGSEAPPPLLLDENLPKALARALRAAGAEVEMVKDRMRGTPDTGIWTAAEQRAACIVTRDADFVALALRRPTPVGIVHCHFDVRPAMIAQLAPEIVARMRELRGAVVRIEPE
jgi:predicted nuclease of predicted toxin-antitoxin system